jgi:hypothetical protein
MCGNRVGRLTDEPHLRALTNSGGYPSVTLKRKGTPERRSAPVHELVLDAFVGPRPAGFLSRHRNGDKNDNRPSNLLYGTNADNSADMISLGEIKYGSQLPQAKLNEQMVVEILRRRRAGESQRRLAAAFHVTQSAISLIERGRNWRRVVVVENAAACRADRGCSITVEG